MDRAAALLELERHHPHHFMFLLRIVRCARCRVRWPCPAYVDARTLLLQPTRLDIAATVRYDNAPRWMW